MSDISEPRSGDLKSERRGGLRSRLAQAMRGMLGRGGSDSLRESLEDVLEGHNDVGNQLGPEERHMLLNILSFGELRVYDVMVPRADVVAVEERATLQDVLAAYRDSSHSRMPVYRETLDDPVGMIHIKDIVTFLAPNAQAGGVGVTAEQFSLEAIRREVLFVPPSMPALDLLIKMQATRMHLALVIDEYGGTDGLVSIEDLVEEIVGDIEDEHDEDEAPMLVRREDGDIDADARAPIEDLEKMTGVKLIDDDAEDDVDTLGGLVFSLVGRVPVRGELVRHPLGLEFEVKDADPRRIKRLRIHHAPDPSFRIEAEGGAEPGTPESRS